MLLICASVSRSEFVVLVTLGYGLGYIAWRILKQLIFNMLQFLLGVQKFVFAASPAMIYGSLL